MALGMTIWAQQKKVLWGTIRPILVYMMNRQNFWNFTVAAIFAEVLPSLQQPLLLGRGRSHGPTLKTLCSKFITAFLGAGQGTAALEIFLSNRIRGLADWTCAVYSWRTLYSLRVRTRSVSSGAFLSAIFSVRLKPRNQKFCSAAHAGYLNALHSKLMVGQEPARATVPVVVPCLIYERFSAPTSAEARTSWVYRRACPKIGAGLWSTFWHGLDHLSLREFPMPSAMAWITQPNYLERLVVVFMVGHYGRFLPTLRAFRWLLESTPFQSISYCPMGTDFISVLLFPSKNIGALTLSTVRAISAFIKFIKGLSFAAFGTESHWLNINLKNRYLQA
jgi:hypothetical protein